MPSISTMHSLHAPYGARSSRANRGYLYPGLPGHIENHRSLVGFDFDPVNSKAYLWHGIPFQCCVYSVHQHGVEMTDITA